MATEKLFYKDCHQTTFSATVTGCEQVKDRWHIILDATCFYPEGGGQACDLGTLEEATVLHVREQGEEVVHVCDQPLAVGRKVCGAIDWNRRFDQMQQHTGEHIVSGLLHKKFGCHNVGFHIGAETMEIDFDCNPTPEELARIEADANAAVWADKPILCRYPAPEELAQLTYRTKKALPWPVRIVTIPETDQCACCGVHTARTGEVGLIKILSAVKFHDGVRLQLVCGGRAYRYMAALYEQARVVSQTFSAKLPVIGQAAQRQAEALAQEKMAAAALQKRLFGYIADSFQNREKILYFEADLSGNALRELADLLADRAGAYAAVFTGRDEAGYNYCIISRSMDLRPLGKAVNEALSGRGGGKPEALSGRVNATRQQIEAFFEAQ